MIIPDRLELFGTSYVKFLFSERSETVSTKGQLEAKTTSAESPARMSHGRARWQLSVHPPRLSSCTCAFQVCAKVAQPR